MTARPDMERILIAIDGSEAAFDALHVGVDLAAEEGTSVTIVHVIDGDNDGPASDSHPDRDDALREAVVIARRAEIEPDLELATGDAAEEVSKLAEQIDADLVIVGSRGLGKASAVLMGSVSRSLLSHCKRPVMVVRSHRSTG